MAHLGMNGLGRQSPSISREDRKLPKVYPLLAMSAPGYMKNLNW